MLEKKLGNLRPGYLLRFEELIRQNAQFGGGTEEDKYKKARSFSNVYEFYVYAYFLGLKKTFRLEIASTDTVKDFWEVLNWKPKDLADSLLASALGESQVDLSSLEHMEEKELNVEIKKVKETIEAYANGGFDYIERYLKNDPEAISDDRVFVNLLAD